MIGFFLKKAFFDGWDNMISLVVVNLGYLLVLLSLYGAFSLMTAQVVLAFVLFAVTVGLHAFYASGVNTLAHAMVRGRRGEFSEFLASFKQMWKHALLMWAGELVMLTIALFVIPFYLSLQTVFSLVLAVVLFWVLLILSFINLYYYPLAVQFPQDTPLKSAKKALVLVADNLLFTIVLSVYQVILFVMSIFLATIIPGISGIAVSRSAAMHILMLKYDYLEEHPEADRKHLPWDELLYEERERVGRRSLRSIIFPWKD